MERIRTKFIVAVTNRLSAAADTNAKLELIEELSDNLYQRYLDFSAQGMDEETAYQKALDDLGDVDELLAYLASLGPDGEIPPSQSQEQPSRSLGDDFMRGLESFLRETISQAEDAVHQAKGIVKDVNDKLKEKYPNGFKGKVSIHVDGDEVHVNDEAAEKGWTFTAGYNKDRGGFFCGDRQSRRVEGTRFPSEALKAVDVGMVNGDVTIHLDDDPAADVVLETESENLEVRLSDDGEVLTVRQGNTASSSFFFGRGLAAADVELTIPRRAWESIKVESTNGDVEIDNGLAANVLRVKTANGDLSLDGANCGLLHFGSASGDLSCEDFTGDIEAETASGDVELVGPGTARSPFPGMWASLSSTAPSAASWTAASSWWGPSAPAPARPSTWTAAGGPSPCPPSAATSRCGRTEGRERTAMNKKLTDIVAYLTWVGLILAFLLGDRLGSRFHLNQALVIWLAITLVGVVAKVAWVGWIIGLVGGIFCAVCWFIGIVNAISGVEKPVPLLGQIKLL